MDCADCLGGRGFTENKNNVLLVFCRGREEFILTTSQQMGYIGPSEGCNKQNETARREGMMNYCTNKILAFAKIPHLHWDVPGDEANWSWRERSAFRLVWMLSRRVVPRWWLKHGLSKITL